MKNLLQITKKPLLLHPLLRNNATAERRGSEVLWAGSVVEKSTDSRSKKLKKVLAGTGKAITFATRFRKEDDKDSEAKPRDKFYDIMSTKER